MLEVNTCVHVCVVAKYCVFVCIICVCMCGERRGWGLVDAHTHWLSSMSSVPCVQVNMLFHTMWFPKIQRYGPTLSPPTPTLTSTLHKHSAQTQWESTGWPSMYAVVCDPYLFLWVLQAASHRRVTHRHTEGPWTLTLCTATAVRGKELLPHTPKCFHLRVCLCFFSDGK